MRAGPLAAIALATMLAAACNLIEPTEHPALPLGTHECFGLAEQLCLNLVAGRQEDKPDLGMAAFRVRCLTSMCTLDEGTVEIMIVWSDGTDDLYRTEWRRVPETGPPESPATIGQPS